MSGTLVSAESLWFSAPASLSLSNRSWSGGCSLLQGLNSTVLLNRNIVIPFVSVDTA